MAVRTVLAFDTSAAHCAAALLHRGKVRQAIEPMDRGQAERLMPFLVAFLADNGLGWRDLDALIVSTGPGNFTGVRIAVSAARGLALGLGIPAKGVSRLAALAHGLPRPVTVIEDARRGEAYVQTFSLDGADPARMIDIDADLSGIARLTGPLAASFAARNGATVLVQPLTLIKATLREGLSTPFDRAVRPAPFYVREADATPPADPPPVILDESDSAPMSGVQL